MILGPVILARVTTFISHPPGRPQIWHIFFLTEVKTVTVNASALLYFDFTRAMKK